MPFVSKDEIETAFNIKGKAKWFDDGHERCIAHDKDIVRRLLRIEEDWEAADFAGG